MNSIQNKLKNRMIFNNGWKLPWKFFALIRFYSTWLLCILFVNKFLKIKNHLENIKIKKIK